MDGGRVLGWDALVEEGVLGAGSCRCLPIWAETEPRKLGKTPSSCQAARSNVAGPSRWVSVQNHLGAEQAVRDGECRVPVST